MVAFILLLPTGCLSAATSVVGAEGSAVGAFWGNQAAKKGGPVIVTLPIEDYSKELQAAAAAKVRAIGDPCSRDMVNVTVVPRAWSSTAMDCVS